MAVAAEPDGGDEDTEGEPEPEQITEEVEPEEAETGEEEGDPGYLEYGGAPEDLAEIVTEANDLINVEGSQKKEYSIRGGIVGLGAGILGSFFAPFAAPVIAGGALTGALGTGTAWGYRARKERRIRKNAEKYTVLGGDELGELMDEAYDLAKWNDEEYEWLEVEGFDAGSIQLYRSLGSCRDNDRFELSTIGGAGVSTYRGKLDSNASEYEGGETLASDEETLEQAAEILS